MKGKLNNMVGHKAAPNNNTKDVGGRTLADAASKVVFVVASSWGKSPPTDDFAVPRNRRGHNRVLDDVAGLSILFPSLVVVAQVVFATNRGQCFVDLLEFVSAYP